MANHCCVRGLYHFDIHWDKTNFSVIHGRCASDIYWNGELACRLTEVVPLIR
jgi:hypothetical protein